MPTKAKKTHDAREVSRRHPKKFAGMRLAWDDVPSTPLWNPDEPVTSEACCPDCHGLAGMLHGWALFCPFCGAPLPEDTRRIFPYLSHVADCLDDAARYLDKTVKEGGGV